MREFDMKSKIKWVFLLVFLLALSMKVICLTWDWTTRVTYMSGFGTNPKMAVDSNNVIHVVWEENFFSGYFLYYKNCTTGGAGIWSAPKKITWTASSMDPAIAVDSQNTIHVIWEEWYLSYRPSLCYKSSKDGGTTWSPTTRLTWTAATTEDPVIITSGINDLHIFYIRRTTTINGDVYYQNRISGIWGAPQRLTWTSSEAGNPYTARDSYNQIHVVWQEKAGTDYELFHKKTSDSGSSWSGRIRVTYSASDSQFPCFDFDLTNNYLRLAWVEGNPGSRSVNFKKMDPIANIFLGLKRLTYAGDCQSVTLVAPITMVIDVVYSCDISGNKELYHKSSNDSGANWSAPSRITYNSGSTNDPDMVCSGTPYQLRLIYRDDTPGNYEIYFKRGHD